MLKLTWFSRDQGASVEVTDGLYLSFLGIYGHTLRASQHSSTSRAKRGELSVCYGPTPGPLHAYDSERRQTTRLKFLCTMFSSLSGLFPVLVIQNSVASSLLCMQMSFQIKQ